MSIRKRGQFYSFGFMENGQRYFGTFNGQDGKPYAHTKQEARDLESALRMKLRRGECARSSDFAQFYNEVYMKYVRENTSGWRHAEFRGGVLKQFFFGRTFGQITVMLLVQYINERLISVSKRGRIRSPVTVYKEIRLLSAVFNMAIQEGVAAVNPCLLI